jgi:hypothetical protein
VGCARSIVINYLQTFFRDANVAIVFIYCNYKDHALQTVSNLVASLLRQMVQDRATISDNVRSFYKLHQDQDTRPTLDEFTDALTAEIKNYSKVFIVVDALDECVEDSGARDNLIRILRSLSGIVNLMVTSRNFPSIARYFQGTKRLEIRANDEDMRRYIEGRIARARRQHLYALQENIVNKVVEGAKGM